MVQNTLLQNLDMNFQDCPQDSNYTKIQLLNLYNIPNVAFLSHAWEKPEWTVSKLLIQPTDMLSRLTLKDYCLTHTLNEAENTDFSFTPHVNKEAS